MKTKYGYFGIFAFVLALPLLWFGMQFHHENHQLRQSTSELSHVIEQEQSLESQNIALKRRLERNKDVLAELSNYLLLPKNETSDVPIEIYDPETQYNVSIYENYLSGFIAYDDCVKVLEKLCEAQLPILITSLSIHRNIAHNYALQLSMTYRTK